jgi:hypothetical protein
VLLLLLLSCPAQPRFAAKIRAAATALPAQPSFVAKIRASVAAEPPAQPNFVAKIREESQRFAAKIRATALLSSPAKIRRQDSCCC